MLADGTELRAGPVVLAAGWQSGVINGLPPDILPPVRPVKGQILRLRGPEPAAVPHGPRRRARIAGVPGAEGQRRARRRRDPGGHSARDTRVTAGGVWELLRDAREIVPGITELELAEATAGLRPGTPDNAPLLGPSALPGLVLATGHFRLRCPARPGHRGPGCGYFLIRSELPQRPLPSHRLDSRGRVRGRNASMNVIINGRRRCRAAPADATVAQAVRAVTTITSGVQRQLSTTRW